MKKIKLSNLKIPKKENNNSKDKKTQILSWILIIGIAFISIILLFALYIIITSPDFDKDKLYAKESSVLYYNDGETELARLGSEDRVLVSYNDLPQVLVDAIVATEDSRFFQHSGLDVARFLKASVGQLLGNDSAGGASTLTMQVVKQTYTSSESHGIKGIVRKFTDIYMSVFKIESNYTKEEIIEFYVNSQWFANNGNLNTAGIAGVEQACQYYFGKSVSDISLAEASIIAGMFQNPRLYNPYKNPEGVRNRQKIVLTLMVNHGYITEEEKNAVLEIPVQSLLTEFTKNSQGNQAIIDYIVDDVESKTGYDPFYVPMKIVTTVDKDVQDVINGVESGELFNKYPDEFIQIGIVVTDTKNGGIVGMSGGRNYSAKGTNRALAKRQPGSTAKILFDYGPAIEYLNWAPSTLILDSKTTYSNGSPITNSDSKYAGLITMKTALVQSRNIPALKTFKAVYQEDPNYIKDFVHNLGIDYGEELYEATSIGGFDGISPLQMSAAYAAYGRGGYYIEPYSYTKATLISTGETFEYKYEKNKVMSEETAYMITSMLIGNSVGNVSVSGTEVAAKGGTSNVDHAAAEKAGIPTSATRDSWNVTYSPEFCIALWSGYDTTTKEHYLTVAKGNKVRTGVMKEIGNRIYSKNQKFEKPDSTITVEIESETVPTQLASDYTPDNLRTKAIFKEGTEPTDVSTRFAKLNAPTGGKYSFDGTNLKLSWNKIETPDAIDPYYLQDYFNTYFEDQASNYYEKRIAYNQSNIGTLGYQIYKKLADGTLQYVDRTEKSSYIISNPMDGDTTYVIKSAYSIFKTNMSDGLEINTHTNIDSNVDDLIKDDDEPINNDDNITPIEPDDDIEIE